MIGVSGSPTLVASLLERGLLDELELTVFPVLAGKGARFFTGERALTRLDLVSERRFSSGVVQLTYRPHR